MAASALRTESQCKLFRIRWTKQRSSERAVDSRFPSEAQRILGAVETSGVAARRFCSRLSAKAGSSLAVLGDHDRDVECREDADWVAAGRIDNDQVVNAVPCHQLRGAVQRRVRGDRDERLGRRSDAGGYPLGSPLLAAATTSSADTTPIGRRLSSITATAWTRCLVMMPATSPSGVSAEQVSTPACIQSRTRTCCSCDPWLDRSGIAVDSSSRWRPASGRSTSRR